jgi:branched-chain amino acid transport system substrate-binding protein
VIADPDEQKEMPDMKQRTVWWACRVKWASVLAATVLLCSFGQPQDNAKIPTVAADAKQIKVGTIHPLTGPVAQDGLKNLAGAKLAVEEINAAGGIKSMGGAKLVLVSGDTKGKPDIGATEAERLIRDGVAAIIGAYQSSVVFVTTQVAERAKIPYLVDQGASDDIVNRGFKYTFRFSVGTEAAGRETVAAIKGLAREKDLPLKSLVVLHEDSLFGTSVAKSVEANAKTEGLQVKGIFPYNITAADLSSEVARASASGADVLVNTGYFADQLLVAKTLQQLQANFKLVIGGLGGGWSLDQFAKEGGAAAQYIVNVINNPNPNHRRYAELQAKLRAMNSDLTNQSAHSYTAVYLLADALERAGTTDHEKLRAALASSKFSNHIMTYGPIVFDQRGQNVNTSLLSTQVQQGRVVPIWPKDFAQAGFIVPPSWKDRK